MEIETNHEIVGRRNSDLGNVNIGSLYPVLATDGETIIGVFSAEFGSPEGYVLDSSKQAYVSTDRNWYVILGDSHGATALEQPTWYGLGNTEASAWDDARNNVTPLPANSAAYLCETALDLDEYGDGEIEFVYARTGIVTATLK